MEVTIQIDVTAGDIDLAIAAIEELCETQLAPLADQNLPEGGHTYGFSSDDADVGAVVLVGAPDQIPFGFDANETQELAESLAALPL